MGISIRRLIAGALALLLPTLATAQTIPGADDPRLRAAALAWVNDEDGKANLWRIGTLAAEGNIAARRFMNRVVRDFLFWDYSGAERAELLALLPQEKTRFGYLFFPRIYRTDPAAKAASIVLSTDDPGEFISAAQTLLEAGEREVLRSAIFATLPDRPNIDIEAIKWAETWVTDDQPLRATLWLIRLWEQRRLNSSDSRVPEQSEKRRARWEDGPWPAELSEEYRKALADGRWTAIIAGVLAPDPGSLTQDSETAAQLMKWRNLWAETNQFATNDTDAPDKSRYMELGEVILEDAPRTPFLLPLRNACQISCPDDLTYCVAAGATLGLFSTYWSPPVEPVITLEDFYPSPRAARLYLYGLGQSRQSPNNEEYAADRRARTAFLPQCLRDAADEQFARTDTW